MKLSFTPPCLLLFLYSSLPSNEQHGPLPGEHSWLVFRVSYWWDRAGLSWMQLFLHRGSLWLGDAGSCQALGVPVGVHLGEWGLETGGELALVEQSSLCRHGCRIPVEPLG